MTVVGHDDALILADVLAVFLGVSADGPSEAVALIERAMYGSAIETCRNPYLAADRLGLDGNKLAVPQAPRSTRTIRE
jgi:hypothetical protein